MAHVAHPRPTNAATRGVALQHPDPHRLPMSHRPLGHLRDARLSDWLPAQLAALTADAVLGQRGHWGRGAGQPLSAGWRVCVAAGPADWRVQVLGGACQVGRWG